MITRIVSGGQTGADMGGLLAARKYGIPTSGWAPRGFRTENGSLPVLGSVYGLKEHTAYGYRERTEANVREMDTCLIFATRVNSPGTRLTINLCEANDVKWVLCYTGDGNYPEIHIEVSDSVGVPGNRESKSPGITQVTFNYLYKTVFPASQPAVC